MLGALNNVPFAVGAGPTKAERIYNILTRALGNGGTAKNDRGIDGLWRRSLAKGLAAATGNVQRAALQAFEFLAGERIPSLERNLGITPPPDANDTQRRKAIMAAEYQPWSALLPALRELLTAIDPRLSIITVDPRLSITTMHGRAFGANIPDSELPIWTGESRLPNYSSSFVLRIRFDVGHSGALTKDELAIKDEAMRRVTARLPSWVDVKLITSVGFVLGESSLGLVGLAS